MVNARYGSAELIVCGWNGVGVGKLLAGTVAGIKSGGEAVGGVQEMMSNPKSPSSLKGLTSLISLNGLKGRKVMQGFYQRQKDKFP
ncbi:MAG TPA: hypothetical protein DIW23_11310 [Anaerolineae bacterium]|nr:hypothetical protein [Anaerolineae bacterium]